MNNEHLVKYSHRREGSQLAPSNAALISLVLDSDTILFEEWEEQEEPQNLYGACPRIFRLKGGQSCNFCSLD